MSASIVWRLLGMAGVCLVVLSAFACSAGNDDTTRSKDRLLLTKPEAIVALNLDTMTETPIIQKGEGEGFLLDASPSVNGSMIAYIDQPLPRLVGGSYDGGSDLWIANRDGTDPRPLFEHQQPNQLVRYPQWVDENTVLAIVQEAIAPRGTTIITYTLQRFDIRTGERSVVIDGPFMFSVARDRRSLVYVSLSQAHSGHTIDVAGIDGSSIRSVEPPGQPFTAYYYPALSPDGTSIAFASFDPSATVLLAPKRLVSLRRAAGRSVNLHGPPQDIWIASADGGKPPTLLAALQEDSPSLAWNGDGEEIYVFAVGGLYRIRTADGSYERIGEGAFHGQIAWAGN